jgi:hypothetical protein
MIGKISKPVSMMAPMFGIDIRYSNIGVFYFDLGRSALFPEMALYVLQWSPARVAKVPPDQML